MIFRVTIHILFLMLIIEARSFDEVTNEQLKILDLLDSLELKQLQKLREIIAIERKTVEYTVSNEENRNELKNYGKQRQDVPSPQETALMARYVVNQADWTSLATVSSEKDIPSFPNVNVISISDGPLGNGSGIPYLYHTLHDFSTQDLMQDHRASLMMTLAQGDYCKKKVLDPMDPRCARVTLTGRMKSISNDSAEYQIGKNALFGRHPRLADFSAGQRIFIVTIDIMKVKIYDSFGGVKIINVKDYLHPRSSNAADKFLQRSPLGEKDYEDEFYNTHDVKPLMNFFGPVGENV